MNVRSGHLYDVAKFMGFEENGIIRTGARQADQPIDHSHE